MTVEFDSAMRRMVFRMRLEQGASIRATALRVGVTPKTLVRFCRSNGLSTMKRETVRLTAPKDLHDQADPG